MQMLIVMDDLEGDELSASSPGFKDVSDSDKFWYVDLFWDGICYVCIFIRNSTSWIWPPSP